MNTDPRGVKRGNCLGEDCDCSLYEYEERNGPKCNYCFCPPTKHKKIENVSVEKDPDPCSIAEVFDASSNNGDVQLQESYVIQNLIPISDIMTSPLGSPQLQSLLPKKFPRQVELALANKSMTPALRNRIVRAIADKCFEENVPSKTVDSVAELAVNKWSPLKSTFGKPSGGLATQIKRRISKLRLFAKKNEDMGDEEIGEAKEVNIYNKEQMAIEMAKPNPSAIKLKQFLDATRAIRKDEVNRTPALQIIVQYPALKKQDLLLWEFTQLINISEDDLFQRWKQFVDKMTDYLKRTESFTSVLESYESLTIEILMKLPSTLPSGKRTNDFKKCILQIFEDNTVVSDIIPAKTDPPRLIAIGDIKDNITFFSYVDGMAIFTEKCPIKAVLLLLATYWVFNIEFIAESRPAFLLIGSAILRENMPSALISKCSAVNCLLKQLDL